jgi:hypothetical protein
MTLKELYQLRDLNREIDMLKRELAQLRASPPGLSGARLTGMPSGTVTGNAVEQYAVTVADLEAMITQRAARCLQERLKLQGYIRSIPDSLTRQIFTLRFVWGYSWTRVAMELRGISADAARMICFRYVKKS